MLQQADMHERNRRASSRPKTTCSERRAPLRGETGKAGSAEVANVAAGPIHVGGEQAAVCRSDAHLKGPPKVMGTALGSSSDQDSGAQDPRVGALEMSSPPKAYHLLRSLPS